METSLTTADKRSVRARRRRERKKWQYALFASVLLHAVVLLGVGDAPLPLSPDAAAGPRTGDAKAARGDMQAMTLSAPQPAVQPVVKPVANIDVTVEPLLLDDWREPVLEPPPVPGAGGDGADAPGLESGEGGGDGGEAVEGRSSPWPHGMFLPPPYDRGFRARSQVWVWVDAEGRVVPDSTRIEPPTSDDDFNRRMIDRAVSWSFDPAIRNGEPVASWFVYGLSIGG